MKRNIVYEYTQGTDHPFLELLHCLYGLVGFLCFMVCPIPMFLQRPDITLVLLIIAYIIAFTFGKINIEKSIVIKEILKISGDKK